MSSGHLEYRRQQNPSYSEPDPEGAVILGSMRANDAQRSQFEAHLTAMHNLGYIDTPEYDQRLEEGGHAKTAWKLGRMLSDLPPLPEPEVPPTMKSRLGKFWASHSQSPAWRYGFWATSITVGILLLALGILSAAAHHNPGILAAFVMSALPIILGIALVVVNVIWLLYWSAKHYKW